VLFKHILKYSLLSVLFALLLLSSTKALAEDRVAVIGNNDNSMDTISIPMLKRMYNNDLLKWPDGVAVILYDLDVYNPIRKTFSMYVLGRKPERIAEDWAHKKISNQALNPPNTIKSERLIIRRVSMQRGAIGYVSLDRTKDRTDIKILAIID
jgi:ABC-type phosphate transport system substrate-binding protein